VKKGSFPLFLLPLSLSHSLPSPIPLFISFSILIPYIYTPIFLKPIVKPYIYNIIIYIIYLLLEKGGIIRGGKRVFSWCKNVGWQEGRGCG
jgi:hypothetical protein